MTMSSIFSALVCWPVIAPNGRLHPDLTGPPQGIPVLSLVPDGALSIVERIKYTDLLRSILEELVQDGLSHHTGYEGTKAGKRSCIQTKS
jgi:hypothetical protein